MKVAVSDKQSAIRLRLSTFCLLLIAYCFAGCSIPNLENPQCAEARDAVKEFYSWYLGTVPEQREKQPEIFRRFISPESRLNAGDFEIDPFFNSISQPTTFKIGKCEIIDPTHTNVQVQLYWRHEDAKTDQREVYADTVKREDKWLMESIEQR